MTSRHLYWHRIIFRSYKTLVWSPVKIVTHLIYFNYLSISYKYNKFFLNTKHRRYCLKKLLICHIELFFLWKKEKKIQEFLILLWQIQQKRYYGVYTSKIRTCSLVKEMEEQNTKQNLTVCHQSQKLYFTKTGWYVRKIRLFLCLNTFFYGIMPVKVENYNYMQCIA